MDLDLIRTLVKPAETKIMLLVIDGLGGLPAAPKGLSELELADSRNLDDLAGSSLCGLQVPVGSGITPGSGPGHLALFGYDPLRHSVGRGVLSALGIGFDLASSDVAARGNFCTVDRSGVVTDRRAGRISSERNQELCRRLRDIRIKDVEIFLRTVKEHRFLLVLRGQGLSADLEDTDPQRVGGKPLPPSPSKQTAEKTAAAVEAFIAEAKTRLADQSPANMVLLRGFSQKPSWPTMQEAFGLKAAAVASYPMYRGVAKLVGMECLEAGEDIRESVDAVRRRWDDFDFFFLHFKKTDAAGEDGDFERKARLIEEADRQIPSIMELKPDVVIVTGDHSTPARLKYHSWHPVPVLLYSEHCRSDDVQRFHETECLRGGLGPRFPACELMPLALANAFRLDKYGA
jgi:2,3-bisphosphoglycerate-independent phosphoglycerate mutase